MYYDKLTELDKARIVNYISMYAGYAHDATMAPLDKILAPWDEAKSQYLSSIFKDELIVSKEVSFQETSYEIENKISLQIYKDSRCYDFMRRIKEAYKTPCGTSWEAPEERAYYAVIRLFDVQTLANNSVTVECSDFRIKDRPYRIQKGAKPVRIISKIAEAYGIGTDIEEDGISDLEYFRRMHSQCLNNKTLKGNLCLSIHPLDYMTMSDNECGWSSCMNWTDSGEYRQGTVEMMNSPCVVVGYLTSEEPYKFGWGGEDKEWNNKKWRCLFIVDKDFIINIKEYPYKNDNLVKEAIKTLAEMSSWENAGEPIEYEYFKSGASYHIPCEINNKKVALGFHSNVMYNDFNNHHYIMVNPNAPDELINHDYNFSGISECVYCGLVTWGWDFGETNVTCDGCSDRWHCEWCGCSEDYEYSNVTADGYRICSCCWDDRIEQDALDKQWYIYDNTVTIRIIFENDIDVAASCEYIPVYHGNIGADIWNDYFTISKPHTAKTKYGQTFEYVTLEECTDYAFEHLEVLEDVAVPTK